jgi:hypothetical protein
VEAVLFVQSSLVYH